LRNNQLAEIPAGLANATMPRSLDLRGNRLRSLPPGLAELPHLIKLDLRCNKLIGDHVWLEQLERRGCVVYTQQAAVLYSKAREERSAKTRE